MLRQLLQGIQGLDVHDLSQPMRTGMPCHPNHPGFRMHLVSRHGDFVRSDGGSTAAEIVITGGHVGTHVDAPAHVSQDGTLFGGVRVEDVQGREGFTHGGVETVVPGVFRGVLLDVAGAKGLACLPDDYAITADDLIATSKAADVEILPGDAVLVRTGWAQKFADATEFLGLRSGVPGPDMSAAAWLVEHSVRLVGSETLSFEHLAPDVGSDLLPVHGHLLVEHGIPILEVLNLESLARGEVTEFLLVFAPLNIVGATGSPVRPLALCERRTGDTQGSQAP